MSKLLVEVDGASVTYRIRHAASSTLKETFIKSIRRESQDLEVFALRDISFSVREGEVLAVIGGNGSGKSTLLKLLSRILPPSQGRVRTYGRVSPMIELGAGFDEELTGRENTILYGTLLGQNPQYMESKAEEICDWAGLREFIDFPLRAYSSGMVAKLAFSVATEVPSDVVLIDEVLSVGDAEFQVKSNERVNRLFHNNSAVVLVSHDLNVVRNLATKALWLDRGVVRNYGDVSSVLDSYLNA